jgi:hypothetical protein
MILTATLVKTSLFLIPSLEVKLPLNMFYVKQISSAECLPSKVTRWNPQTATWIAEAGYSQSTLFVGDITFYVGHKSYHAIDKLDKNLKSYDYVGIKFEKEFK